MSISIACRRLQCAIRAPFTCAYQHSTALDASKYFGGQRAMSEKPVGVTSDSRSATVLAESRSIERRGFWKK